MVGPIVFGLIHFTYPAAARTGPPALFDLMRVIGREIFDIILAQSIGHGGHLIAFAHAIVMQRVLPVVDMLAGQH
jgi:hypothetical protein